MIEKYKDLYEQELVLNANLTKKVEDKEDELRELNQEIEGIDYNCKNIEQLKIRARCPFVCFDERYPHGGACELISWRTGEERSCMRRGLEFIWCLRDKIKELHAEIDELRNKLYQSESRDIVKELEKTRKTLNGYMDTVDEYVNSSKKKNGEISELKEFVKDVNEHILQWKDFPQDAGDCMGTIDAHLDRNWLK